MASLLLFLLFMKTTRFFATLALAFTALSPIFAQQAPQPDEPRTRVLNHQIQLLTQEAATRLASKAPQSPELRARILYLEYAIQLRRLELTEGAYVRLTAYENLCTPCSSPRTRNQLVYVKTSELIAQDRDAFIRPGQGELELDPDEDPLQGADVSSDDLLF